jgi:hypothetical protein
MTYQTFKLKSSSRLLQFESNSFCFPIALFKLKAKQGKAANSNLLYPIIFKSDIENDIHY